MVFPDLFPAAVAGQRNACGCTAGRGVLFGIWAGGLLKEPPQGGGVPDGQGLLCKLRRVWGPFRIQGSTLNCWPPCTASPPSDGLPGSGGHSGGGARAPASCISLVASVGPRVCSEKRASGRTHRLVLSLNTPLLPSSQGQENQEHSGHRPRGPGPAGSQWAGPPQRRAPGGSR